MRFSALLLLAGIACGGKGAQTKEEPAAAMPPSRPAALRPNESAAPELARAGVRVSATEPRCARTAAQLRRELAERGLYTQDDASIDVEVACVRGVELRVHRGAERIGEFAAVGDDAAQRVARELVGFGPLVAVAKDGGR